MTEMVEPPVPVDVRTYILYDAATGEIVQRFSATPADAQATSSSSGKPFLETDRPINAETMHVVDGKIVDRVAVVQDEQLKNPPPHRQLDLIWKALTELRDRGPGPHQPFSMDIELALLHRAKVAAQHEHPPKEPHEERK